MKSLLTTTAISAFLLTGAAIAQEPAEEQTAPETEEVLEEGAEQPATVEELDEDGLDQIEDAEALNKTVLDATTKERGAQSPIREDAEGNRQQMQADSSTTPDAPQGQDTEMDGEASAAQTDPMSTDTQMSEGEDPAMGQDRAPGMDQTMSEDQQDQDYGDEDYSTGETDLSDTTFGPEDDISDDEDAGMTTMDGESRPDIQQDRGTVPPMAGGRQAMADTEMRTGLERFDAEEPVGPNMVRASNFLGQDILGAEGEEIAEVEDLIIDSNGQATDAVIRSGGILGLGKKTYLVSFDELQAQPGEEEGEIKLSTNLTKERVKELETWSRDEFAIGEGGRTLASELRNAEFALMGAGEETVGARDVVMSDDGKVEKVVVAYGGSMYAAPYRDVSVAEGDAEGSTGYRLNYNMTDFENAASSMPSESDSMEGDSMEADPLPMPGEPVPADEPADPYTPGENLEEAEQDFEDTSNNLSQETEEGLNDAERSLEEAGRNIDQAGRDIENATENAAQETGDAVQSAAEETSEGLDNTAERTERAAENAAENTERATENAVENTEQAAENAAENTEQAAENAAEETGEAVDNAREETAEEIDPEDDGGR